VTSPNTPPRPTQPLGRRIPRPVWRLVNGFMRAVLGLPFPTPLGKRLMLVNLTGRKTGRRWRQPISYVRHEDVLLTPGGGNWKLNLRPDESVRLRINGRDQMATPELVRDRDTASDLLAIMIASNPAVTRFSGMELDAEGRPDPVRLGHALDHGFAIVRWHLDQQRS
jgi:hypothetical protein